MYLGYRSWAQWVWFNPKCFSLQRNGLTSDIQLDVKIWDWTVVFKIHSKCLILYSICWWGICCNGVWEVKQNSIHQALIVRFVCLWNRFCSQRVVVQQCFLKALLLFFSFSCCPSTRHNKHHIIRNIIRSFSTLSPIFFRDCGNNMSAHGGSGIYGCLALLFISISFFLYPDQFTIVEEKNQVVRMSDTL